MSKSLPSLPAEAQYYEQAQKLDNLMTTPASMTRAAKFVQLPRSYAERVSHLGTVMSPHNQATGEAFSIGSMAGLVLTRMTHGPFVYGISMAIELDRQYLSTEVFGLGVSQRAYLVTGEVVSMATEGLDRIGQSTQAVVDGWSERVAADTNARVRFRHGVGFTALLANMIHSRLLRDDLEQRAQHVHDFDWDAALHLLE